MAPWMARFLLLLSLLASCLTAAQPATSPGVKGWCQEPSIGEAKNPGPSSAVLTNFDADEADGWDEEPADLCPLPGEARWEPDTSDIPPDGDPNPDQPSVHQLVHQWEARAAPAKQQPLGGLRQEQQQQQQQHSGNTNRSGIALPATCPLSCGPCGVGVVGVLEEQQQHQQQQHQHQHHTPSEQHQHQPEQHQQMGSHPSFVAVAVTKVSK